MFFFSSQQKMTKSELVDGDAWLNNMNNCYILFDPDRKETMAKMCEFINTKIDPVIILSCFVMNTHQYLDNVAGEGETFRINDKFVEEAIKKFAFGEVIDKEIIDKIRCLVFCGKDMTKESVFLHIWNTIIEKFLPVETPVSVVDETDQVTEVVDL